MCFAIEYAKTFPKLLGWFSMDPVVAQDPNEVGFADDEDVAAEVLRVERMGGVLGDEEGEVVLRGLRKVYRTQQASMTEELPPRCKQGPICWIRMFSFFFSYDAGQPDCLDARGSVFAVRNSVGVSAIIGCSSLSWV